MPSARPSRHGFSMRRVLKKCLGSVLPAAVWTTLQAVRSRRFIQRVERRIGLENLNRRYEQEHGRVVRRGPFQGMEYTSLTTHRHITQRLLGVYECELGQIVDEIIRHGCPQILDIGCAEGYYAVGFARAIQRATVLAFDTDPWARKACIALARHNGVAGRVDVRGFCSREWLLSHAPRGGLIMSDCEGFERILFNAGTAVHFAGVDLLVEIHNGPPRRDDPMVLALDSTHVVTIVMSEKHDPARCPELNGWDETARKYAVSDMRQPWQGWFYFRSRTRVGGLAA